MLQLSLRDTTSRSWSWLRSVLLTLTLKTEHSKGSSAMEASGMVVNVFDRIPIEHRPPIEACLVRGVPYPNEDNSQQVQVMITPPGLEGIYNPSFDVTPAELITAIVTEKGVAVKAEGQKVFDLTPIV